MAWCPAQMAPTACGSRCAPTTGAPRQLPSGWWRLMQTRVRGGGAGARLPMDGAQACHKGSVGDVSAWDWVPRPPRRALAQQPPHTAPPAPRPSLVHASPPGRQRRRGAAQAQPALPLHSRRRAHRGPPVRVQHGGRRHPGAALPLHEAGGQLPAWVPRAGPCLGQKPRPLVLGQAQAAAAAAMLRVQGSTHPPPAAACSPRARARAAAADPAPVHCQGAPQHPRTAGAGRLLGRPAQPGGGAAPVRADSPARARSRGGAGGRKPPLGVLQGNHGLLGCGARGKSH